MKEQMVRVRGKNLIHEGRGYHNVELELPEGAARHYINLGKAVEVVQTGAKPVVQPESQPTGSDAPFV